ncbi:MAG: hypothetical protein DSM106950_24725 [Stigonema ocellatum SAG 48.90 = DSM 106950]|uniref:hypothetical protein n=1 Tax=Spirosoma sp. TaxID=1899569 RepID=UPI00262B3922|nr:hypothetical protein [Spirosoma sp.]MBR8837119.1 hypothetical protein [Stigonema ocellatum SAG 48.90 = DSM 106950]MCX6213864.1 hypothetical protein [Spirosoma sp.]
MKQRVSINFLAIILGIGLLASLGVNVYQLYHQSVHWPPDSETIEAPNEAAQLQQQLSRCSWENTRKDSVIACLKHQPSAHTFSTFSTQPGP